MYTKCLNSLKKIALYVIYATVFNMKKLQYKYFRVRFGKTKYKTIIIAVPNKYVLYYSYI